MARSLNAEWKMKDSCSGEKCSSVPNIKLCNGFRTLETHGNVMVFFYNVFAAFVGLNNNTIVAMRNIEFGSVSSD